jgi:hypothetical protein
MDVSDNACILNQRGAFEFFARRSYRVDFHVQWSPPVTRPLRRRAAYLRGEWTASHLHFKRLRASVSAKQNGFWQIVH